MAVSKVVYGNQTLVDLTGDTVTADTLAEGVTAHNARGEEIVGTMSAGGGGGEAMNAINYIGITPIDIGGEQGIEVGITSNPYYDRGANIRLVVHGIIYDFGNGEYLSEGWFDVNISIAGYGYNISPNGYYDDHSSIALVDIRQFADENKFRIDMSGSSTYSVGTYAYTPPDIYEPPSDEGGAYKNTWLCTYGLGDYVYSVELYDAYLGLMIIPIDGEVDVVYAVIN